MQLEIPVRAYARATKQPHDQASRHKRKSEVNEGEDEKPAKKRTGLSSSTLAKSLKTICPWSNKPDSTFLGIPLELRLEIYKHFFTLDRNPESPPSAVPYENWDLTIPRINRQIRAEGLRVLQKTKTWIAVSFVAEARQELAILTQATIRTPQAYMSLASLGIKRDEIHIFREGCLKFWLGWPYRTSDDRSSEDSRSKASQAVLFAYNQQAWANFCLDLWVMRQQYDRNMVLEIRKPASWTGRDFVDKVLFPLIQIRGLSKYGDQAEQSTLPHKMMGNAAMTRNNSVDAMWYYEMGLNSYKAFHHCYQGYILPEQVGDSSLLYNLARSLRIDLCNNFVLVWSKLAESRRSCGQQQASAVWDAQLKKALKFSDEAQEWPGILDEQRCKAHYIRGLAQVDRGEYGVLHGEGRRKTLPYFKTAAKKYYYVRLLRPPDAAIATAMARVGRARVSAPLREFRDQLGRNWRGAAELWYKRLRHITAASIFRMQERPSVEEMRALGVNVGANRAVDEC